MSQENVEVLHRGYDAMRRRDLQALLDIMDPEVDAKFRIMEVEGTVYKGHEGMRRFAEEVWSVFPDWEPRIEEARDVGDAVIAKVAADGRGVGSGLEVGMTVWQVVKFRAGKVVLMQGYTSEEDALDAVGLGE